MVLLYRKGGEDTDYLVDYHIHSIHSSDAESSVLDICRSAEKKGLKEIVITDHYEPNIGEEHDRYYDQQRYRNAVLMAREAFDGKLIVKFGVELGQPHLYPESCNAILEGLPYDYVIGSIHKGADGVDVEDLDYSCIKEEDICSIYLNHVKLMVEWNNFDCVGHLDLIKRYSADTYKRNLSLTCRYELLEGVLKAIIRSGKGIEINTSGLRQAPKETMPGPDVLRLYRKLGGEILTIGSDSHRAEDVGKGVAEAVEIARGAGFQHITVFNGRKPEWISISRQY